MLCDRVGLPLAVLVSAANTPDAQLLMPLLDSVAPIRSRRGRPRQRPDKLHAGKAYDQRALRAQVRRRGIGCASPARASNPHNAWGGTDGSSKPACHG